MKFNKKILPPHQNVTGVSPLMSGREPKRHCSSVADANPWCGGLLAICFLAAVLFVGFAAGVFPLVFLLAAGALLLAVFFSFYTQAAFYLLVAYLPFQVALNVSGDIDLLSGRLLILLLFLVWILKNFKERKPFWQKNQAVLILFFIIAVISVLAAQNQGWAIRKILVFASIFPLFFIVAGLVGTREQLKKVFWMVAGSALAAGLIAFCQFLAQFVFGREAVFNFWSQRVASLFYGQAFGQAVVQNPSWLVEIGGQPLMRAIGLFPDPHMLAFYLGMVSPLILALAFMEKKYRIFLFVVFGFLLAVLLLTFSRGGYLGLAGSIAIMTIFSWRQLGHKAKIFISSLFFVAAVLIVLAGAPIADRFFSSFDLAEGSNSSRIKIWGEALNQAKQNILLGVGLGNYPLSLNFNEKYRSAVTSHNLYLDILVETGIFGLLAWLWFLGGAARAVLKETKRAALAAPALGVLGALIYFAVHSFFETAIFNPTILAFFMIITGLAANLEKIRINSKSQIPNKLQSPKL